MHSNAHSQQLLHLELHILTSHVKLYPVLPANLMSDSVSFVTMADLATGTQNASDVSGIGQDIKSV